MNKLVATLATTTVLFAASTVYFAYRAKEVSAGAPAAPSTAASGFAAAAASSTSSPATARTPSGNSPATIRSTAASASPNPAAATAPALDHQREAMLPYAKDFLRQYDDSAQRAQLIKTARPGIESQFAMLKDRLKLDATRFGKIVDLLAEEQIESQANYYRCLVTQGCDSSTVRPPTDHSDELLALLGSEGYAQFISYRKGMPEWQAVVQLRGRLSESNYLSDGSADRLITTLSAERERYLSEANQAGVDTNGWGNGTGMIWYAIDGGLEERMASATQYAGRMRELAAGVLTAEQLRVFAALQEEQLAGLASYLHSQNGG